MTDTQPSKKPVQKPPSRQLVIGRIVRYTLTAQDAKAIEYARRKSADFGGLSYGTETERGQVFPAAIVRISVDKPSTVNLKVFLDGTDTHWIQDVELGVTEGTWAWPPR